eukprot:TCONS_00037389-protein
MFGHALMLTALGLMVHAQKSSIAQRWPPLSKARCSQTTKLKAMYGRMTFNPPLSQKPMTSFEVDVEWNDLQFHPTENRHKRGGVYVSYTMGMKNGPGGYFGVQMGGTYGGFIFSIWDGDRTYRLSNGKKQVKKSTKLVWPMDLRNCKRNCQDCGLPSLRDIAKRGFTTGTKCITKYPMKVGDRYTVKLSKAVPRKQIHTSQFGGFRKVHEEVLGEKNRFIKGSVWQVSVTIKKGTTPGKTIPVGTIMFESDEIGFNRLGTFDEMIGCNKCNAIYHKDTRYGPIVSTEGRYKRRPVHMEAWTRYNDSTCKKYQISGSKRDCSLSFESGPLTKGVTKSRIKLW